MTTTPQKIWTEEELLDLPHDGHKYELVEGELHIMSPAGFKHGVVCINLATILRAFCSGKHLGLVADGQAGFYMRNGDLFSPDVSFVSFAKLKSLPIEKRTGFFEGAPELAIEVLSPTEPRRHIKRKIEAYLENGTAIVWVADPVTRTVLVYKPGAEPLEVKGGAQLAGDPVLPGLSFPASAAFEDIDAV
jgi:Uma2 family endonuclease